MVLSSPVTIWKALTSTMAAREVLPRSPLRLASTIALVTIIVPVMPSSMIFED